VIFHPPASLTGFLSSFTEAFYVSQQAKTQHEKEGSS
jgi:hypothetical protein